MRQFLVWASILCKVFFFNGIPYCSASSMPFDNCSLQWCLMVTGPPKTIMDETIVSKNYIGNHFFL